MYLISYQTISDCVVDDGAYFVHGHILICDRIALDSEMATILFNVRRCHIGKKEIAMFEVDESLSLKFCHGCRSIAVFFS